MDRPNVGDRVRYVLKTRRSVPAIVTRVIDENTVNLVVFAEPSDGQDFATGTAAKLEVKRWIPPEKAPEQPQAVAEPPEMWYVPLGHLLPHY